MNTPTPSCLSTLFVAALALCATPTPAPAQSSVVQRVTAQSRPMAFVGNIQIAKPQWRDTEWIVPFGFSGGEWQHHSGIAVHRIDARVIERTIHMTVVTAVAGGKPVAFELRLGNLAPGRYAVVYQDPDGKLHALEHVDIPMT